MTLIDVTALAGILRDAAKAEILPRFRRLEPGTVKVKSNPTDLVTEADTEAEWAIKREVERRWPGTLVVGEESVAADPALLGRLADAEVAITVDPVDGTHEFSLPGREDWAVHIALWQRSVGAGGGLSDAVVALPARGEVYRSDTVTPPGPRRSGPLLITASSNRPPAVLWRIREQLDFRMVRIGSAGAKAMAVVRGDVM